MELPCISIIYTTTPQLPNLSHPHKSNQYIYSFNYLSCLPWIPSYSGFSSSSSSLSLLLVSTFYINMYNCEYVLATLSKEKDWKPTIIPFI